MRTVPEDWCEPAEAQTRGPAVRSTRRAETRTRRGSGARERMGVANTREGSSSVPRHPPTLPGVLPFSESYWRQSLKAYQMVDCFAASRETWPMRVASRASRKRRAKTRPGRAKAATRGPSMPSSQSLARGVIRWSEEGHLPAGGAKPGGGESVRARGPDLGRYRVGRRDFGLPARCKKRQAQEPAKAWVSPTLAKARLRFW